jgi:hypothetical protein
MFRLVLTSSVVVTDLYVSYNSFESSLGKQYFELK